MTMTKLWTITAHVIMICRISCIQNLLMAHKTKAVHYNATKLNMAN